MTPNVCNRLTHSNPSINTNTSRQKKNTKKPNIWLNRTKETWRECNVFLRKINCICFVDYDQQFYLLFFLVSNPGITQQQNTYILSYIAPFAKDRQCSGGILVLITFWLHLQRYSKFINHPSNKKILWFVCYQQEKTKKKINFSAIGKHSTTSKNRFY